MMERPRSTLEMGRRTPRMDDDDLGAPPAARSPRPPSSRSPPSSPRSPAHASTSSADLSPRGADAERRIARERQWARQQVGQRVRLQSRSAGGWVTATVEACDATGLFHVSYEIPGHGQVPTDKVKRWQMLNAAKLAAVPICNTLLDKFALFFWDVLG